LRQVVLASHNPVNSLWLQKDFYDPRSRHHGFQQSRKPRYLAISHQQYLHRCAPRECSRPLFLGYHLDQVTKSVSDSKLTRSEQSLCECSLILQGHAKLDLSFKSRIRSRIPSQQQPVTGKNSVARYTHYRIFLPPAGSTSCSSWARNLGSCLIAKRLGLTLVSP